MLLHIRKNLKFNIAGTILIIGLAAVSIAFGQTNPRKLSPGQSIRREMTGAETHCYQFDLKKGEFFQVSVEQKGIDVMLKLLDAGGNVLATMNSPNGAEGTETLSFAAEKSGDFVLEVSGFQTKLEKGIYILRREFSNKTTAKDRRRVEVERVFAEAITPAPDKNE